ncbi:hypothetical protein CASFOL_034555 [Castilleja foliolosa]|uniref:F-box associated beta-propeller type 3 domain-containing protein n=1 Tax=Castilleja foliolosa TaxID=1961234 RepID=A0ABD3BQA5_9LAMI
MNSRMLLMVRLERQMRKKETQSIIHVLKKRVKVKNGRSHPYHLRKCKRLNLFESNIYSIPDEIVFYILVQIPAQDIYRAVRSIELTRLNYEPEHHIWCSSSNRLILEYKRSNYTTLCIANPVTMQRFSLPPTTYALAGLSFFFPAIAYASISMKYKVVRVDYNVGQRGCTILTIGVDKSWRPVCTQHLSLEANKNLAFRPMTTEGFVHWAKSGNYVLTLNVETEIITEYSVPSSYSSSGDGVYYFSTVKYLSERDSIYKSAAYNGSLLMPAGWLEYKEVLLYRVFFLHLGKILNICIAWNTRLKELELVQLDSEMYGFFVHRNSLLWLDGC